MRENKDNILVPVEITVETLKAKIYLIRGQRVMFAADLAEIYGYSTKTFNQQVRNNIEKFDEDFRFQITREELDELVRSKILTSRENTMFRGQSGGTRYLPWCFTESGVYMLMTVLKGELAVRQSKALIRTFKSMKDYIEQDPLQKESFNITRLSLQVSENTKDISEIRKNLLTKDDLTKVIQSFSLPDKGIEYLIYAGQTFEADVAYADIYSKSKKKLYIVDNYIGPKTLLMLKSVSTSVDVIIFSDNLRNILRLSEFNAFQTEYPNVKISLQKTGGKFHDRYIIIDYKLRTEQIYHCGASSKDAGNKITTIALVDNKKLYYPMIDDLLQQPELRLR